MAGTGAGRVVTTVVVGRPKGKTRSSRAWRELGDTLVEGEVTCTGRRFKDDELLRFGERDGVMGWEEGWVDYKYVHECASAHVWLVAGLRLCWRGERTLLAGKTLHHWGSSSTRHTTAPLLGLA